MNGSLFKFILSSILLAFVCTVLYGGIQTTEKVIAVQASVSDDEPASLGSMKGKLAGRLALLCKLQAEDHDASDREPVL